MDEKTELRYVESFRPCHVCGKSIGQEVVRLIFEPYKDSWRVKSRECMAHRVTNKF